MNTSKIPTTYNISGRSEKTVDFLEKICQEKVIYFLLSILDAYEGIESKLLREFSKKELQETIDYLDAMTKEIHERANNVEARIRMIHSELCFLIQTTLNNSK